MSFQPHAESKDEILKFLDVTIEGLNNDEIERRLKEYGPNELTEKKRRTPLQMFLGEFKDIFILLLIAASVFSMAVGYYEFQLPPLPGEPPKDPFEIFADSLIIIIIVILVAVAGFVQEYRAEKAMDALKKLAAPKARVIRDDRIIMIPSRELVPGDILVLESGDLVPADARLIESVELKNDEAVLTGESTPVNKDASIILQSDAPVNDKRNMVFVGTHVIYGRGKAVVTSTGMKTEFGKIAELVQEAKEEDTPLQKRLDKFAKKIAKVVVLVCIVIFALEVFDVVSTVFRHGGTVQIEGLIEALLSAISLAVSAVPEGLPAVVTITLALGAREFVKRNAIVRKLSAAEGLGAVTVICSDKTGTLTKGEMTVRQLFLSGGNRFLNVSGVGYEPKGEFQQNSQPINPEKDRGLLTLLQTGTLCNNSGLERSDSGAWTIMGDPTEGALVVAGEKAGLSQEAVTEQYRRIGEIPFSSERKCMTTIHETLEKEKVAYMKGAPEVVLEKCDQILENEKELKLTDALRSDVLRANEQMASSALRVLAMAYRRLPSELNEFSDRTVEEKFVFVGLVGMIDPPREEAIEANDKCRKAGIRAVMITGDHKLTAVAVAKEIGIMNEESMVLTGTELDALSEEDFAKIVENVAVYARVSPEHKLKIVKALENKGEIVAMTGDGVNDAPALKQADIGVAMGITGTDVSKEAADVILIDDNFATIVKAVEQGRVIYENIRKYARFLIACNFDELLVIGSFAILGGIFGNEVFPIPMLPAMILWINLVTDGAPAISLATDPPEGDVMERKPRNPQESILHGMGAFVVASFLLQAFGSIFVFCLEYYIWPNFGVGTAESLAAARTCTFVQASVFELLVIWNCRSETRSIWRMGRDALKNRFFVISVTISFVASVGITFIPATAKMFGLLPLSLSEFLVSVGVGCLGLLILPEVFMRRKLWKWD
ncbi:cation-translocating P-type ATPase [Candidatus Bathyarchaeota archaeon]|nr:cation-translocating P-type ATPase [Candidatus Bathyarchaeota archaeon]